jgi:hypothetical protein
MTKDTRPGIGGDEPIAGFQRKDASGDSYIAQLRVEHGIPEQASLEDIEPIVRTLLGNPGTALRAAELVLNRRVDGRERLIGQMVMPGLGFDTDQRFGMLVIERTTEDLMREQGITDFGTTEGFFSK